MKRRLAVAALVFAGFGTALVQPAVADDLQDGGNNVVQAKTQSGTALVQERAKVKVTQDPSSDVEDTNVAVAQSTSCTDCRTVAAAIQIVIVENPHVTTYQPQNGAAAVNDSCLRCATAAFARQIVLTPYHAVHLSESTREQIHEANDEADRIVESNADFPTMSAEIKDLASRLAATVQSDIDNQSSTPSSRDDRDDEREA